MSEVDPLQHLGEAIAALGRADAGTARAEMATAVVADPSLQSTADAVALACHRLDTDGRLDQATWNVLADACPAELRDLVEGTRA
jgi:hypothetical protein